MSLSAQYAKQEQWRHWEQALARIPLKAGQRILDLGCGVGQRAAHFFRLGAQVIGVDVNDELLAAARARQPELRFEKLDVNGLTPETFGQVDGIWASFVAAYLPDLESALARWRDCLSPGGWMALVEIDDLFGHQPLPPSITEELHRFYESARGRYDFECGRRLAGAAQRAGLTLLHEDTLPDDELAFDGAAAPEVLEAWRLRLQRMPSLREFLGAGFPEFEKALLDALAAPDHRSQARVVLMVAER